jgi:hypothetical protein
VETADALGRLPCCRCCYPPPPSHAQPACSLVVEGEAGAQKEEDGQTWGVKEWLVSISLQGYTDAMIEYGYDSLIALDAASEQEIKDMTEDEAVAMKKPHRACSYGVEE